jgi:tetratricopeptide (TPR) repeat protein
MKADFLHRFLHAINSGEQRMCKKAVAADTGKWAKQRMRLFDTLMRQQTYDAERLAKAIGDAAYLKELPSEKHRMYKRLLHTVMEHRANIEDNVDPMEKLRESQLLFSLGMRQEAIAVAEAGLERSRCMGEPLSETCLHHHIRQVLMYRITEDDLPLLHHNGEMLMKAAEQTVNMMALHVESDKVECLHRHCRTAADGTLREELEQYMGHPLLNTYRLSFSQLATLRNYRASAMYQEAIGNLTMAANFMGLAHTLLERFPAHSQMWPELYIACTSDLAYLHLRLGRASMAQDLLQGLKAQVKPRAMRDRAIAFSYLETCQQHLHLGTGNAQAVVAQEGWVREQLDHYGHLVPDGLRLGLCYNIGIAHLAVGNDRKALAMFSRIRDMGNLYARHDLQGLARLFRLMLLMERDTLDRFEHYLRNSRPFFNKDDRQYALEQTIYHWIGQHWTLTDDAARQRSFSSLTEALRPMEQRHILGAEEFRIWAQAHAQGVPVREVYRARFAMAA